MSSTTILLDVILREPIAANNDATTAHIVIIHAYIELEDILNWLSSCSIAANDVLVGSLRLRSTVSMGGQRTCILSGVKDPLSVTRPGLRCRRVNSVCLLSCPVTILTKACVGVEWLLAIYRRYLIAKL